MSVSLEKPYRKPIRLRSVIYNCIDSNAAFFGLKAGTVANQILAEELQKIAGFGINRCVVKGSDAYKSALESGRIGEYYVIPDKGTIDKYMPAKGSGDISSQVSFYMSEKQLLLLEEVVRLQNIVGTIRSGKILTHRFAVVGLLLNNEILKDVEEM